MALNRLKFRVEDGVFFLGGRGGGGGRGAKMCPQESAVRHVPHYCNSQVSWYEWRIPHEP